MSSEDIERRRRLESAVEDDDWSSVIDGQTKLTEEPKVVEEAPTATIMRCVAMYLAIDTNPSCAADGPVVVY